MHRTILAVMLISSVLSLATHSYSQDDSHPHIFFDRTGMEALRDRALQNPVLNKMWLKFQEDRVENKAMKQKIVGSFGEDTGREYGDALADLTIAYIVTRDARYLKKAKTLMLDLAELKNWGKPDWSGHLSIAHISIGYAFCWDVMYDKFSSSQRSAIRAGANKGASNFFATNQLSNHNWTPSAAEGLLALAFKGEVKFDDGRLRRAKDNFKEAPRSVLWAHGADGFSPQGLGYWRKYNQVALFFHALRRKEPENDWFRLNKEFPGAKFLEKSAYPRIYTDVQHPDMSCIPWGDSQQIGAEDVGPFGCMGMLALAASEYRDGYALDFLKTIVNEGRYRFEDEDAAAFIFYDDTDVPARSYRDLALSGYWPNMEAAVFRGGWDKNDLVFFMRSGSQGGHAAKLKDLARDGHSHPDANGFLLYYNNDYLAAEDGAKPNIGRHDGLRITYGHNTLLVDGRGQKGDLSTRVHSTSANMDFLDAPHVGYLLGDATDAYANLEQFYRQVIYKKHKYVVILDEIKDDAKHQYEFLLGTDKHHFIKDSGGGKFAVKPSNGSAKLPVVFVEPQNLKSEISTSRPYAFGDVMVDLLKVRPASRSQNAVFFTLLYPRKENQQEPEYRKIYEGDRSGVVVDGDEYHLYNGSGSRFSYRSMSTDAKLSYHKENSDAFEYLAAGSREFSYDGIYGFESSEPLVAAFEGRFGQIRLGKNLGTDREATVTLLYPGATGVLIDGHATPLDDQAAGRVTFRLRPKQYKTGPTGFEQTVTENYAIEILAGATQPFVRVLHPNGGEKWQVGDVETIGWNSDGQFNQARIEYSTNGGSSWKMIVTTTNDGSHSWTIPSDVSSDCMVRISNAADGAITDKSDAVFSIVERRGEPPRISSFTPTSGATGISVSIKGQRFLNATQVQFAGAPARFSVASDTLLTAVVPTAAASGTISISNAFGTSSATRDFIVSSGRNSVSFLPTDDGQVKITEGRKNYGSKATAKVSKDKFVFYLKFKVEGLTSAVAGARLKLHVADGKTDGSADGGSIHLVANAYRGTNTPWTEGELKANNAPQIQGTPLGNAGKTSPNTVVEFDLTQEIQANGVYSFAIANGLSDEAKYYTKEEAFPPELVIALGDGPTNQPPVAEDDTASTPIDISVPVNVLSNDHDSDGTLNTASVSVASNPDNGSLRLDGESGVLVYTPATGFSGQDSFQYTVEDDQGAQSNRARVLVAVTDTGPREYNLTLKTQGQGSVTLDPGGARYPSGTSVVLMARAETGWRFTGWSGDLTGTATQATILMTSHKDVTATFQEVASGTTLSFTPVADVYARSSRPTRKYGDRAELAVKNSSAVYRAFLRFKVSGLTAAVKKATLELHVVDASSAGGAVHSVSNNDRISGGAWQENTLTWQNAPDITGAALSELGGVSVGQVVKLDVTPAVLGNGAISLALQKSSGGKAAFSSREGGNPPRLIVEMAEGSGNQPPVAQDDDFRLGANLSAVVNILENDHDPDGSLDPGSVSILNPPARGSVAVNPFSGLVTFTAGAGFTGQEQLVYDVADRQGLRSNPATARFVADGGGGTTTSTFEPTNDNQVKISASAKNYGAKATTKVEEGKFVAYYKFEVSGPGSVRNATLRLFVQGASVDGGSVFVTGNSFAGTSDPWLEETLTAENAPVREGAPVAVIGSVQSDRYVETDVSKAVSGSGAITFAIANNSSDQAKYTTKEDSRPPELVVVFASQPVAANAFASHDVAESTSADAPLPDEFSLSRNYPNPFNGETVIRYALPQTAEVRITIYNIRGQKVVRLVDSREQAGLRSVTWDGRNSSNVMAGSGVYLLRAELGGQVFTRRIVLQK